MATNDQIIVAELLRLNRQQLAICGDREPELSNLLRDQIRLEDRARKLTPR